MKIIHFSDAQVKDVEDDTAMDATRRDILNKDDGAKNMTMRVFEIAKGGCTPWYFFEWEHDVFIHSGRGEVLYENKWIPVAEGYIIHMEEGEEHQVRNRGDEPLVIVSMIPAEE